MVRVHRQICIFQVLHDPAVAVLFFIEWIHLSSGQIVLILQQISVTTVTSSFLP